MQVLHSPTPPSEIGKANGCMDVLEYDANAAGTHNRLDILFPVEAYQPFRMNNSRRWRVP